MATAAQTYLHPNSPSAGPQPAAYSSLQPSYLEPTSKPPSERNIASNPKPTTPSPNQLAPSKATPVVASASQGLQQYETAKPLLQPGAKPLAKVSPERNEIQITYDIESPKLELIKNYGLGATTSLPTTFKAMDDRNLVVGFEDGTLKVMDLVDLGEIKRQIKLSSKILCIENFEETPGNNPSMAVLCGTGAPDHAVVHLELQARESMATKFKGHSAEVTSVCPLGRGDFVSGGHDGQVIYWNIRESKYLAAKQAHNARISSMCTLNLNQTLVTGSSDCSMVVFHISQREFIHKNTLKEAHPITMVSSFYGNCKFALSCLETGTIRIWNVEDGE
jgi:WD domain, G-beta repeat